MRISLINLKNQRNQLNQKIIVKNKNQTWAN
jgi:hypothetical protein